VPVLVLVVPVLVAVVAARKRLSRLLGDAFQRPPGFGLRAARGDLSQQIGKALRTSLGQVEPVHRFGEPQVGVHARDHDAGVDGEQLDSDQSDPDIDVDHEPLVEDEVDDLRQAARRRSVQVT
jgi:hypothetical protein